MGVAVSPLQVGGVRLLVIEIPEARALYTRNDGAAKRRVDDGQFSCKPMTEEQRRSIDVTRCNPDFTNEPSPIRVEDLPLPVIEEARRISKDNTLDAGRHHADMLIRPFKP